MDTNKTHKGFVVNIENSLNFDIDIDIGDKKVLNRAKTNKYSYEQNGNRLVGTMYACRIKGVKSKNNIKNKNKFYKEKDMLRIIKTQIDKNNGWINISLCNIDQHSRLIVSMYTLEGENLSDIILKDKDNFDVFET